MRWCLPIALLALAGSLACASGGATATSPTAEVDAGIQAGQRGYWQEALFRFERARTVQPDNVAVLNNIAVAFEALGRYDEALATYKEALAKEPKNTNVRRNYARFAEFYTSYARGVLPKGVFDANR